MLFNGDEESQSAGSGETVAAIAERHHVVLSYEPTAAKAVAGTEGVRLAAAGTGTVTMTVKGRGARAGAQCADRAGLSRSGRPIQAVVMGLGHAARAPLVDHDPRVRQP